jgi:HK97 family phage portal protein
VSWLDFLPWRKSTAIASTLDLFREIYGGHATRSGKDVNWKTALEVSTAFACARVIADGISQVPLKLFREAPDGRARVPAKDHPLYDVLHRRPNEWQTSYEYRETLGLHLVFAGNHFSFKNRGVGGRVVELIPLQPGGMTVKRVADGTLSYRYRRMNGIDEGYSDQDGGEAQDFTADQIWHLRGPSWSGWLGLNAVKIARESIGLAIATEENHAKLHANGNRSGGMISVEGTLDDKQYKQLRDWLAKEHEGPANAWKDMIMDRKATYARLGATGVDAQHLETRRYQVEEICRHFRVMPIMVGYSDKAATYASAEQMFLAHVVHTLSPWYERIEQSIDVNLLTDKDRKGGIYAKFVEEGLLRGSLKDTKDYLLGLVNGGLMTPNEGRAKLDLNADADPLSDELRIPANITGADNGKPDPAAEEVPAKARLVA